MLEFERIVEHSQRIISHHLKTIAGDNAKILVTVVLGSGLDRFAKETKDGNETCVSIPYANCPWGETTVSGHSGEMIFFPVAEHRNLWGLIFSGRIHAYEFNDGQARKKIVVPVVASAKAGCQIFVITNAVGAINTEKEFGPGNLILVSDHLNFSGWNPFLGNESPLFDRFPNCANCYDRNLRDTARLLSEIIFKQPMAQGVLAAMLGPSLESPAEVRALGKLGADIVGMSVVYEALALRALKTDKVIREKPKVVAISCCVNWGEGLSADPITHENTLTTAKLAGARLSTILKSFISANIPLM